MNQYKKLILLASGFFCLCLSFWGIHSVVRDYYGSNQLNVHSQSFDGVFLVDVEIAEKTYKFLLSTGQNEVVLDTQLAKQVTVPLDTKKLGEMSVYRGLESGEKIHGGRGVESFSNPVQPVSLKMGPFSMPGQDIWSVMDLSALSESLGVPVSGLLGVDTFRQFTWEVSNHRKSLQISRGPIEVASFDKCIGYSDEYGTRPGFVLSLGKHKALMPITTGSSTSFIGKELVEQLRTEPGALTTLPRAGTNDRGIASSHIISEVFFEGQPLGPLLVSEEPDQYGTGMDVFARFSRYAFIPSKMLFCYNNLK